MRKIKINTWFMKLQFIFAFIGGIIYFWVPGWVVMLILMRYGENTKKNTEHINWVLNKTWQKFGFIYGLILFYMELVFIILKVYLETSL